MIPTLPVKGSMMISCWRWPWHVGMLSDTQWCGRHHRLAIDRYGRTEETLMNRHQHQRLAALVEALEAARDALSWSEARLLRELQEIRQAQAGDTVHAYLDDTYGQQSSAL